MRLWELANSQSALSIDGGGSHEASVICDAFGGRRPESVSYVHASALHMLSVESSCELILHDTTHSTA